MGKEKQKKLDIQNIGEPLHLTYADQLVGVVAEPSKEGHTPKIWTRLGLTSDEPVFHTIIKDFTQIINNITQKDGHKVNLHHANTILLILRDNQTAELWIDRAAVGLQIRINRSAKAGTVIFEKDITDITGMNFPCVDFKDTDKVICVFRQEWRFALAFDMNPEGKLDIEQFNRTLGTLYRRMRFKQLYDAVEDTVVFNQLLAIGWFPFAEIIHTEFKDILNNCMAGFDIKDVEKKIITKFDETRMEKILERWLTKPHFSLKTELLKVAISAFNNQEPIAVIKILLTEIEGILNEAYSKANKGKRAKTDELLKFAEASAKSKAGDDNTLLLPKAFSQYLKEHTFANFDPVKNTGKASSRHAVGHGAASQESYTMSRALQTILTLDQLAFYT